MKGAKIQKYISLTLYAVIMLFFVYHAIEAIATMMGFTSLPEFSLNEYGIADNRELILLQCILGIIVIHVPFIIEKFGKYRFPLPFTVIYDAFLFGAIYFGEVQDFYITVDLWDDVLHALSSILLGLFAFMLVYLLNKKKSKNVTKIISPLFISIFAFAFVVMAGAFWEIYEFTFDIFDLNMQKYRFSDLERTPMPGRDALFDTMKDIIVDTVGGLLTAIYGYISLKRKKGFIYNCVKGENSLKD